MKYSYLVKKHMAMLNDGVCTIIDYEKEQGIINNTKEVVKAENVKCRLSYKSDSQGEQTDKTAEQNQIIKLFLPPEIQIKEGCKVIVTQEGETNTFLCAGKSLVYGSHKEVVLEIEKRHV